MATPNDPYVERVVTEQPATIRREEVYVERKSSTGWWVAALVAIVAVVGLFFLFNGSNTATETDLQVARESGRSEAMLDNATTQAQAAAASATEASRNASASMADATRSAADSASAAAERTADATQNAAANAGDAAAEAVETPPDLRN